MAEQTARTIETPAEEYPCTDDGMFRSIVEGEEDYVFISTPDHRITYANPSLVNRLGRQPVGEMCYRAIHGYDEVCPFCIYRVTAPQGPSRWEFVSPRDGSVYDVSLIPIKNADGEESRVFIMHDITKLRSSEKAVRSKNETIEGIISGLPGLFFVVDGQKDFVRWNLNLEKVSGFSGENLAGMGLLDLFLDADREMVEEMVKKALDRGKATVEIRLVTSNGEKVPYMLRASRIQIDDASHLVVTGNDLLERYEAEKLLHQLSRAVEQSPVSIVITNTEGTIEYVNDKFCQVTGYSLAEAIGQNPRILKSDFNSQEDYKKLWQTILSGEEWRGEFHNRKKNGDIYWENASISPIKDADGVITHFLAVKEDITERKIIERELHKNKAELLIKNEELQEYLRRVKKSKNEWESTMDCIDDIVILANNNWRIKRCNKALADLVGKEIRELIGMDLDCLLAEQGLNISTETKSGTELHQKSTGRWFVFHSYPFTDSSVNEVTGSVITLRDNTMVKSFTEAMEKANTDLKATQAKVIQQEKMASIGQLAAGVAHEINNPMGFISSNLGTLTKYLERMDDFIRAQGDLIEMVTDDGSSAGIREKKKALKIDYILDDGKELIKESQEGAERVRTIVQNLKSFSRVDEAECKQADINECILSTINIVWNELKYKASLIKELGDIPLTRCHPQQINQVIMNLLVNASHAIEKQGEITVRTWSDSGSIFISVSDTGCGMPPEVVNRIFEPFYTTKEVGKGTGLGLSITYDIVKGHNGEIAVESEPGKGTTFSVQLPVVDGKKQEDKGKAGDA